MLGQIAVGNGLGRLTQARLQTGTTLGRVEGFGLGFFLEQDLDERPCAGQGLAQGRSPGIAQHVIGVAPVGQQAEPKAPPRLQQGQGAFNRAASGALTGGIPVKT
ncbi:MAG TPA: hypothetical protein DCL55_06010 [Brevundimonas sp.]|nr:hypothetical protein [Brevundimonas sp.]